MSCSSQKDLKAWRLWLVEARFPSIERVQSNLVVRARGRSWLDLDVRLAAPSVIVAVPAVAAARAAVDEVLPGAVALSAARPAALLPEPGAARSVGSCRPL